MVSKVGGEKLSGSSAWSDWFTREDDMFVIA
jgi:hypothetical protein